MFDFTNFYSDMSVVTHVRNVPISQPPMHILNSQLLISTLGLAKTAKAML